MCEPRGTWFWKWKHSESALLSIVWEWWKCMAEFHFQTDSQSQRVRVMPRWLFLKQLSQQSKRLNQHWSGEENPKHFSTSSSSWRKSPWRRINCRAPKKRDPKRVGSKTTPIERKIDFHYFWLPNQGQSRIQFDSISRLWTPFLATTLRLIESPLKFTHFLRSQSSAGRKRVLRKRSRFFRNALFSLRPRQATPIKRF